MGDVKLLLACSNIWVVQDSYPLSIVFLVCPLYLLFVSPVTAVSAMSDRASSKAPGSPL